MQRGVSLIESIVVVGIFALMIVALANLFLGFGNNYSTEAALTDTGVDASALTNEFAQDVLAADAIVASHSFAGVTYTTDAATLVLQLPAIDSTGATITSTYDYIALVTTGTYAYRYTDASPSSARKSITKTLARSLSALTFTYDNADPTQSRSVTIDATTSKQVKGHTAQDHLVQTTYLRNN